MELLFGSMPEIELATDGCDLYLDDNVFDCESCGICMDIVIDRGVLDCCEHWFCFACIDNWASITNLCPLCKNEFQIITCLPVFDTIGNISEKQSLPRDDDWCIQGKNNTLSFPSYYIDEDAVTCLDGDGCRIREGLSPCEENLTVDTSVACDSCDIWYHAFCVGFNPQLASENSWLCPRCVTDLAPKSFSIFNTGNSNLIKTRNEWSLDSSLLGKVSISVADTGDTDVVVSIIEGIQKKESDECSLLSKSVPEVLLTDASSTGAEIDVQVGKNGCVEPVESNSVYRLVKAFSSSEEDFRKHSEDVKCSSFSEGDDVKVIHSMESHDQDISFFPCDEETNAINGVLESSPVESSWGASLSPYGLQNYDFNAREEFKCEPGTFDGCQISEIYCELSTEAPVIDLLRDPSIASSVVNLARDEVDCNSRDDKINVTHQKNSSIGASLKESMKRSIDCAGHQEDKVESNKKEKKNKAEHVAKKARSDEKCENLISESRVPSNSCYPSGISKTALAAKKDALNRASECGSKTVDIMSIVQEKVVARFPREPPGCDSSDTVLIGKENQVVGPRVRKIMRRSDNKNEHSNPIQNLRKEIREAVENKNFNLESKKLLSGELLTAFRTALARPHGDSEVQHSASSLRMRKALIQKGKVRKNLIKKIYSTSTGRRRKAWDKDVEVEFWKHRCSETRTGEVETLRSVLEILKKTSSSCSLYSEAEQASEKDGVGSILSRVYVADSSVFPRKDDIKPLSTSAKNPLDVSIVDSLPIAQDMRQSSSSSLNFEVRNKKGEFHKSKSTQASLSRSSGAHEDASNKKEHSAQSDKKKWAIEILARKTAISSIDTSKECQDFGSSLKMNYPLLAQLPADMRPVIASSPHNKVSAAIRQAQLYRITEHFLHRANISTMCRAGETELAVVDAVNIEKEIFEKSNSKSIYVNLCSQFLSRQKTRAQEPETTETAPREGENESARNINNELVIPEFNHVEEALKMAGLFDSPPCSPDRPIPTTVGNGLLGSKENVQNVTELASHPNLDIHVDFDYELMGGVCLAAPCGSADVGRISAVQLIGEDLEMEISSSGDSCEVMDAKPDSAYHPSCEEKQVISDAILPPYLLKGRDGDGMVEVGLDCKDTSRAIGPSVEGPSMEASAECKELYGLGKKPPVSMSVFADALSPANNAGSEVSETREEMGRDGSGKCLPCNESPTKKELQSVETTNDPEITSDITYQYVASKVEAYVKEHIRPLCKSGVITAEQYRWAVVKTTKKVMSFHGGARSASFLVKEGTKVKKLAEQYVEASQRKDWRPSST